MALHRRRAHPVGRQAAVQAEGVGQVLSPGEPLLGRSDPGGGSRGVCGPRTPEGAKELPPGGRPGFSHLNSGLWAKPGRVVGSCRARQIAASGLSKSETFTAPRALLGGPDPKLLACSAASFTLPLGLGFGNAGLMFYVNGKVSLPGTSSEKQEEIDHSGKCRSVTFLKFVAQSSDSRKLINNQKKSVLK